MTKTKAIILDSKDNVGLALMNLAAGTELELEVAEKPVRLKLLEPISYQHKFSTRQINSGSEIIKYGIVIGVATKDIVPGEHVHVHNMTGLRAKVRK